jgi:hypothetical protein
MPTQLNIKELRLDKAFQMRLGGINVDTVDSYADAMDRGDQFPPVTVYRVNGENLVVDGWHRVKAAATLLRETITADVIDGTYEEAYDYCRFVANRKNGMRLTRYDLQALVEQLVLEPKYADLPNTKLAEIAGVAHVTIARARERLGKGRNTYAPAEFVLGAPPLMAEAQGNGMPDLTAKIASRLEEHLEDLIVSIDRLDGSELVAYLESPTRQAVRDEIRRLEAALDAAEGR